MRSKFHYIRPDSLKAALDFLAAEGPDTALLAGGTDLMISIRKGELSRRNVLDVTGLEEIRPIRKENGLVRIGAGATFSEIIASPLVRKPAPVLVDACRYIGSVQIRNVGTIGGNIANASPAADSIPPLVVHRGRVVVRSAGSERTVPIEDVVTGPYQTDLNPGEIITDIILEPAGAEWRYSFQRIARRRSLAIARMSFAALTVLDEEGKVAELRLSAGSVTPTPCRMRGAEEIVMGEFPSRELIEEAAVKVSEEMVERTGVRPTTEYKRPALEGLATKALTELFC
jgi:CO/xanthine dehydrogenase FAD-binding subunit